MTGKSVTTSYQAGAIENRVSRVSFASGVSTFLTIGFQLVSVRICLVYWGQKDYGRWLTLYAAFMCVRSLDSGFVSYVGNKLNYLYHQDKNVLREHLASAISGVAIIGALQLSIGVAAFFSQALISLVGVPLDSAANYHAGLALLVLIGTWALYGPYLGTVHRLVIPAGLMYQGVWWTMGSQVCQFIGLISAAMLRLNLLETSLVFAFIQFIVYAAYAGYIRSKLPAYYPWWHGARLATGIKDLVSSTKLTACTLIEQASTNGTVILLSALSGPAAVPIFTTVRTVANCWMTVSSILTNPLLPEIVRYHATNEKWKLLAICEAYWVFVSSTLNLGILLTYPFIKPLYGYWTSHAVALDKPLLCFLLADVVLGNVGALIASYIYGINSLGVMLKASIGRGVLNLALGGYLLAHFGFVGFGLAIVAGELFVQLVYGHQFFTHELPAGSALRDVALAPIALSTVSTLIFLMGEAFGLSSTRYLYPAPLIGAATAALWGWHRLAPDVKRRLRLLIGSRFVVARTA